MIKIYHNKFTYLITPIPYTLEDLIEKVIKKVNVQKFQMVYTDKEQDQIVLKDQDDYQYARDEYPSLNERFFKIALINMNS